MKLKLYQFLLGILIFSLPFGGVLKSFPNIVLVLLGILYPFTFPKSNTITETIRDLWPFVLFLLYVFFCSLLSSNLIDGNISLVGKLGLVFLIAFLGMRKEIHVDKIKLCFVWGVTTSVLITYLLIAHHFIETSNLPLSNGKEINRILLTERPYLAFYSVVSFVLSLEKITAEKVKTFWIWLLNLILVSSFVLFISARIAVISILIISVLTVFKSFSKKKASFFILSIAICVVIGIFTSENMVKRFKSDSSKSIIENAKIWEPRVVIWECGFKTVLSQDFDFLIGTTSTRETKKILMDCYENTISNESKKSWFLREGFNTHNQYLSFAISFGLIGVSLFFFVILKPYLQATNNFAILSLTISIFLFAFVENFFERQIGAYVFAIFLIFSKNPYPSVNSK